MRLASTAISLQFLTPTPDNSTAWMTHLQTDTEEQAWQWLDRLEREYPTRKWRWVRQLRDTDFKLYNEPQNLPPAGSLGH